MSTDQISTVGELMDYLATQPRDRKVILQKDAEGNGYSPLADASEAMYSADSTWSGEVHITPEQLAEQLASTPATPTSTPLLMALSASLSWGR